MPVTTETALAAARALLSSHDRSDCAFCRAELHVDDGAVCKPCAHNLPTKLATWIASVLDQPADAIDSICFESWPHGTSQLPPSTVVVNIPNVLPLELAPFDARAYAAIAAPTKGR